MENGKNVGIRHIIGLLLGLAVFTIILVLPTPSGLSIEAHRMAAIALLMATWWITEAIPIPVTALLPIPLFPLLKIMPSAKVAPNYTNHLIFLFIGGFLLAAAIQKWNLHKRIALNIIKLIGTNPHKLLLGFMIATAFLAMWISNTATTMMILPVAMAVVLQLAAGATVDGSTGPAAQEAVKRNFGLALMLAIAYSASIGGIGTLIGTPPNIVFAGFIRELYPTAPEIGFMKWMMVGVPIVIVFLPIVWLVICRFAPNIPLRKLNMGTSSDVINQEIKSLGPMTRGEKMVATVFFLTILLWMFRSPINLGAVTIPGWTGIFPAAHAKFFHDSTVAIGMAVLLFLLPESLKQKRFLLDWRTARKAVPWGIVLLFGGGFALASGFKATGLDTWIGGHLGTLGGIPIIVLVFFICLLMTYLTELTSNTATSTMMMPILAATAVGMGTHPLILMIPATISASCAFTLPIATPPNAIVFGSGWVTIPQMARIGFFLSFFGALLISILAYSLIILVFGIDPSVLPDFVRS